MEELKFIENCEKSLENIYKTYDRIALHNTEKVMRALQKYDISTRHFSGTTGYGYGDEGRDKLAKVYSCVFGTEEAIVSPLITCGSHALTIALFGLLRPGDLMLSIAGKPYDTLDEVISLKEGKGSLADFGIKFEQIELLENGEIDEEEVLKQVSLKKPKLVYLQRSRGYSIRKAFSINVMEPLFKKIKELSPKSFIMVDNCYGEFVEEREPTEVLSDVIVGSLIKNPGGGLAQTGAYIAGTKEAIELIGGRFTSSSLGLEVGSYEQGYRNFYQGFFLAPHVVSGAIKGAYLIGEVMSRLGYNVIPKSNELTYDIIKSIEFNTSDELIKFVQLIQKNSPIDSSAVPEPWDMPGYTDQVIMAAGTFVGGASIELSCDSPIRPPYFAYLQGGLVYEHCKIVAIELYKLFKKA